MSVLYWMVSILVIKILSIMSVDIEINKHLYVLLFRIFYTSVTTVILLNSIQY